MGQWKNYYNKNLKSLNTNQKYFFGGAYVCYNINNLIKINEKFKQILESTEK